MNVWGDEGVPVQLAETTTVWCLEVELLGLHVGGRVEAEARLCGLRDQTRIFVDLWEEKKKVPNEIVLEVHDSVENCLIGGATYIIPGKVLVNNLKG